MDNAEKLPSGAKKLHIHRHPVKDPGISVMTVLIHFYNVLHKLQNSGFHDGDHQHDSEHDTMRTLLPSWSSSSSSNELTSLVATASGDRQSNDHHDGRNAAIELRGLCLKMAR